MPASRLVVLVTGSSRGDVTPEVVTRRLDQVLLSCEMCGVALSVLYGAAPGVDAAADTWAKANDVEVQSIEADWVGQGGVAGPVKNRRLLAVLMRCNEAGMATRCEAFPGRASDDVWGMVKLCRAQGLLTTVTT